MIKERSLGGLTSTAPLPAIKDLEAEYLVPALISYIIPLMFFAVEHLQCFAHIVGEYAVGWDKVGFEVDGA